MIKDFSVENYLSIREKQSITFESVSKSEADDMLTVEVKPNLHLNKLAVFYGANASGKSNMLWALETIFMMLFKPSRTKEESISTYRPFALCADKPTKMSVSFFKKNIQYNYQLEYCQSHIIYEKLEFYPSGVKSLFYERKFVDKDLRANIQFGNNLGLHLDSKKTLAENTWNNNTVLSTCGKISLKEDARDLTDLHTWIKQYVHDINGDEEKSIKEIVEGANKDPRMKKFFIQMLCKADFNITDFSIVEVPNVIPAEVRAVIEDNSSISDSMKKELLKPVKETPTFVNHSDDGDFSIPQSLQSAGTLHYLKLLDFLYDLISGGHIYFLDELSEFLHEDLLSYYISTFLFNSKSSQLIFTTQDSSILDEDFIARDMVWISEKSKTTASSEYQRASSFGLHKNLSLYKSYRIGRLGGKPELGSPYLNLED